MKHIISICALVLFVVGCATTPTPVPTVVPTAVPTAIPQPTAVPTSTPLPPTPTTAPTNTRVPPTNTPIPTTPAPTATNTRRPVTPQPTATATETVVEVSVKYSAPDLIEPKAGDIRTTNNDLVLRWQPVGALGSDECYLVTLRVTNAVDGAYGEQRFLADNTCNDAGDVPVSYVVRKRAPAPNYDGLVSIASAQTPTSDFRVTWNVVVVKNNGADPNNPQPSQYVPVSPPSQTFEFNLQG